MNRRQAFATVPATLLAARSATAAASQSAAAGSASPRLIELYTSEGCSSCPPADRWLSGLRSRSDIVALAFHVNYWDRLGWPDRFANPAYTQRQQALMRPSGARYVYTPQVLVDGRDWRDWPSLPGGAGIGSDGPALLLRHENGVVIAEVGPASRGVAGFWALAEDRHSSRVQAGENAGSTLLHDNVVRRYEALGAWPAGVARAFTWAIEPAQPAHPRRAVFVVIDAASLRPLRVLALAC